MKWNTLTVALGLAPSAQALLRFGCARLTIQRLDPLVNPGLNPSPHLHQVMYALYILLLQNGLLADFCQQRRGMSMIHQLLYVI